MPNTEHHKLSTVIAPARDLARSDERPDDLLADTQIQPSGGLNRFVKLFPTMCIQLDAGRGADGDDSDDELVTTKVITSATDTQDVLVHYVSVKG